MIKSLKEYIKEAEERGVAIGHFNVSNIEGVNAIYNVAKKLNLPVIIGVSEGEENFIGKDNISNIIKGIREKDNYPIFLNADHHYTFEKVKDVLDLGFDSAIIDGAKLSIEENISLTKKCVEYAEKKEKDILIEGEIGFIGQSSKILDEMPEGVSEKTMTKPEDAKYFVQKTGVHLLSASVGNIHGMIKGGNPKIDIERIREIRKACGIPLVLHGGSGISDDDFKKAIKAGISVIHINTEIRIAYRDAVLEYLKENPNEIAPYKIIAPAVKAIEEIVEKRLRLFNNLD